MHIEAAIGTWLSITGHTFDPANLSALGWSGTSLPRGWLRQVHGRDHVAGWEKWGRRLCSWTVPRHERERRGPDPDRVKHRSSWAIVEHVAPRPVSAGARRGRFAPAPSGRGGIRVGDRRYRSPQ